MDASLNGPSSTMVLDDGRLASLTWSSALVSSVSPPAMDASSNNDTFSKIVSEGGRLSSLTCSSGLASSSSLPVVVDGDSKQRRFRDFTGLGSGG